MLNFSILPRLSICLTTIYTFKILNSRTFKRSHFMAAYGTQINVDKGTKLPDGILNIKLHKDDGTETSLKSILAELPRDCKGIVLFIYPMANTPGCTEQACDFRDHFAIIKNKGFLTYGISADTPESQTKWKNKHNLPYILLCDRNKELISALNCRLLILFTSRSHVIIDRSGTVLYIERGVSAGESRKNCVEFIDKL